MGFCVKEEGEFARIEVWRGRDDRGLYKAWAVGRGGRFLLGAMLPEGERLVARRRVEIKKLRTCGAWPVVTAEAVLTFPFERNDCVPHGWKKPEGAIRLGDELLTAAAARCTGALVAKTAGGFRVAYPYSPGFPFPLMPIFCFAEVVQIGGKPRAVFTFNQAGFPIFSNSREGTGDNRKEVRKKGGR